MPPDDRVTVGHHYTYLLVATCGRLLGSLASRVSQRGRGWVSLAADIYSGFCNIETSFSNVETSWALAN